MRAISVEEHKALLSIGLVLTNDGDGLWGLEVYDPIEKIAVGNRWVAIEKAARMAIQHVGQELTPVHMATRRALCLINTPFIIDTHS